MFSKTRLCIWVQMYMFGIWFINYFKHVFLKEFKASMCFKPSFQVCFHEYMSVCPRLLSRTLCAHGGFSLLMWRLASLRSLYISEGTIRCAYVKKDIVRIVPMLRKLRHWQCSVPTLLEDRQMSIRWYISKSSIQAI